jgi:tetratricopeptide (TPR) repeat protein
MIRSSFSYFNVLSEDIATNNWAEGRAVFDDAVAHNFDSPRLHTLHWMLAFLQNDASAMQGDLKWARQNPAQRYQVIDCDSWFEAFHGRLRNSGRLMRESVQESARPDPTITAYYLHSAALQEVEAGNPIQGQQLAEEGLKASGDYNSKLLAALVFARSGRADEAQKLADAVDREQPRDSLVQKYCLPAIRAAISLYRNDPSAAIEILRVHQDYDLAYTDTFNNLYPAYLRGLAYLQMGQGHQAAAEFQKILDHPGIMGGFVTGALARLQLARAQAMTGDDVAARKSYQQFLSLWKNADPDIPIYKQAKAEYAGLR